MEWWKIVLIVFGVIYTSLIVYQIVNHQIRKYKSSSADKIKSAMIRADKQYQNMNHEKRVQFVIDKHINRVSTYEYVIEFITNFSKWIVSILYSCENHIQIFIQWIIEYIKHGLYVFSRKSGIMSYNI